MAYVITQNCCKDAACVPVCPVDCIRPVGNDGERAEPQMLYIDPAECIDCGACELACPVDAIYYEDDLPAHLSRYSDINANYFERHPLDAKPSMPVPRRDETLSDVLRVAVVGSGPAACYAVQELVAVNGVQVDVYERLPTPFGLIRSGVAPDHQRTKSITNMFSLALATPSLRCHFNVEVGKHLSHDDLMAHHHAVIYGVGASGSRDLGIIGEHLAGSEAAADFVGWYNGHPDQSGAHFDLTGERAVIIGNGNVALDVARVLLMEPADLQRTDIATHSLLALARSNINEVIIIGRRGPRHAAFSAAEFLALGNMPGVDVIVASDDLEAESDDDVETALKIEIAREYAMRGSAAAKRVIFRFMSSPTKIIGTDHVEGLQVSTPEGPETIKTSLVLRSIGYRGSEVAGLPFDGTEFRVPNDRGRACDEQGAPIPGVYVTGWIKRGPTGVIGTNKVDAKETVAAMREDFDAGRLQRDLNDRDAIKALLIQRNVEQVTWDGWRQIDAAERERGEAVRRPRLKLTDVTEMLEIATS